MVEISGKHKAVIFFNSKSVFEVISLFSTKNYLIPLIKSKYHFLVKFGFSIQLVLIPSHVGIVGNEMADAVAKRAVLHGQKPKFKVPHTNQYFSIKRCIENRFLSQLEEEFREKDIVYFFHCFQYSLKP